ncbi:MAG: putative metal-binding motif-containing protein, partial [Deltaproteobacteria bacterium]|nr:putative metal-binding motif-containing protein [Deltaproteobacteria bacterium]
MTRQGLIATVLLTALALVACDGSIGTTHGDGAGSGDGAPPPPCTAGSDKDGDGYGTGCASGNDCDDSDAKVNPGATEVCDGKDNDCDGKTDEGVSNACGTCASEDCTSIGDGKPFPTDPTTDPNVKKADGVATDSNGDLVLKRGGAQLSFMWIANTYDPGGTSTCPATGFDKLRCRGTVSKVDTDKGQEVARYYSLTCASKPGTTGCLDVNGKALTKNFRHTPSRTAVDYNMDVWVANRAFGGQPSATKIAHDPSDCVDRNNNGTIDTSADRDGDGKINIDCDGDKLPDSGATKCSGTLAGKKPEFYGDDDECVLFTVAYGDKGDIGRSVCLDAGKSMIGASNAWVGTYDRPKNGRGNNLYYKINGVTGKIELTVTMPAGHWAYGCTADGHNVLWSTDRDNGNLAYFSTVTPYSVGKLLVSKKVSKVKDPPRWHYGIAVDGNGHIWLGGAPSSRLLRYKPVRTSFATLGQGKWTIIYMPCPGSSAGSTSSTRGVAPDDRGKVWLACTTGTVIRVDQSIADGTHDLTGTKHVWKLKAEGVIGVGIDPKGHVWGIGHANHIASRLEVDSKGDVTANSKLNATVGLNPYTYSDFTGFGLRNFVRPQGIWTYQLAPCKSGVKATWKAVTWKATTPAGTAVAVRVRTGDSEISLGPWSQPFMSSPADLSKHTPNPAKIIRLEFTLTSKNPQ